MFAIVIGSLLSIRVSYAKFNLGRAVKTVGSGVKVITFSNEDAIKAAYKHAAASEAALAASYTAATLNDSQIDKFYG